MAESKPTVMFELRFVLMQTTIDPQTGMRSVRPGIHHLLSLLQYFNVGVFNGVEGLPDEKVEEILRTQKLPAIYECLTSNECIKIHQLNSSKDFIRPVRESSSEKVTVQKFMEKNGYGDPRKMFFNPIATIRDVPDPTRIKTSQRNPGTIPSLNQDRVIIIDNPQKYTDAGRWRANVVKCMWAPKENQGEYQWEAADEFKIPSSQDHPSHVPMMRILCRLLIEALYNHSLHMTKTSVYGAVKDIGKRLADITPMARNQTRVSIDRLDRSLHSILLQPHMPSKREMAVVFPHAFCSTTTLAPSPLERQDPTKTTPRAARRKQAPVYVGFSKMPTILINLALLVNTKLWSPATFSREIHTMPGVLNICFLRPYFRIGVFCNWAEVPARAATAKLNQALHSFLHPNEGASPAQRDMAHKLQQLVKKTRINPQDPCIDFLLHSDAGRTVCASMNLQNVAEKCVGIEPENTLILDVAGSMDKHKRQHTVVVPDLSRLKGGPCRSVVDVSQILDVSKGRYPLLRIISSAAVTSLASHRSRQETTDKLQGVAIDLQKIMNELRFQAYKPPAALTRILQQEFGWCHAPNALTPPTPRAIVYSDEALAPLCTSFVLKQKQSESEASVKRQPPNAVANYQQRQAATWAQASAAAPVGQQPSASAHPQVGAAVSAAAAAAAAAQQQAVPQAAPHAAAAQQPAAPGASPGAAAPVAAPVAAQPRPGRGRARKGLYAPRPAAAAAATATPSAPPDNQQQTLSIAPAAAPDQMQLPVRSQQPAAEAVQSAPSATEQHLAYLAVAHRHPPAAPEQPAQVPGLLVPGLQTTNALPELSAGAHAAPQAVSLTATLPAVAPGAVDGTDRPDEHRQVPGLPPQLTATRAVAAQAPAEEPASGDEPMYEAQDETVPLIVRQNAALLAKQDEENNPYHQRLPTAEEIEYIDKGLRPPNWPAHTCFIFPEKTASLAIEHGFTELHFEIYDLFRHIGPSHYTLDFIEVMLDAMNDTLEGLSPPCQAVLHGSWASSLFALDSSLDITILQEHPVLPKDKGYHNTKFANLSTNVKTRIKNQLNKVNDALTKANLQIDDDAEIKDQRSGYPMLQTKLRVPKEDEEDKDELVMLWDAKITFGDVWGPQHAIDTAVQLQLYKPLRPLFLVLRQILHQRGLDNPKDGGLPPYILFSMVGAHLAIEMTNTMMVEWVKKYGNDEGFEQYWYHMEPRYSAGKEPVCYNISVADQLEYVRLLGDVDEVGAVEDAALVADFEGGKDTNDLGHALVRFLCRFTPAEHENSPVFDQTKDVISFFERNIVTLDVYNEQVRGKDLPALKYPGKGIMVEDPQNRRQLIGQSVTRWDEVVAVFERVKRTIEDFEFQKTSGNLVTPVSDAHLRVHARAEHDIKLPDNTAMAPTTLVLGRLLSLDLAVGPSRWNPNCAAHPPFEMMREESAHLMQHMDEQGELLLK